MKRKCWVSYYLQDGTQTGATLEAENYEDIENQLNEMHPTSGAEIADYGFYDEEED